jgi:hypothetical protein
MSPTGCCPIIAWKCDLDSSLFGVILEIALFAGFVWCHTDAFHLISRELWQGKSLNSAAMACLDMAYGCKFWKLYLVGECVLLWQQDQMGFKVRSSRAWNMCLLISEHLEPVSVDTP